MSRDSKRYGGQARDSEDGDESLESELLYVESIYFTEFVCI